ncbi:hypothetical protein C5Y96_01615 [Blastopirellula marina]|uniref:Uncharacterized protein n=1 Tax=Blastopirellula marina TaxID=124 RepID=A0A2S8G797_9BACT|nr:MULTISPECIES: hypothetical protein [Pirellulaceae]PQO40297.1 hypothetical protein C5Y96_01615 [Blastopirellula marina]RCS55845.1 hypothetical protein DTL36_01615 [Bremerella cremea]
MTASPIKTVLTLVVCSLTVFNNPSQAQACWLTDWLWGTNEAYPVAPPVITTNYPAYPSNACYPTVQANYQPSVVGSCAAPSPVTTVGYAPQMNYNSQYQQVPVTVYRPVPVYQPNSAGVPVVGYQGCTTSRYQVQRVPAFGAAPAPSSCGCASAGYNAPVGAPVGGAITSPAPGQWVPRVEEQPMQYSQPQPQVQVQPQYQTAPPAPSYGSGGSIYSPPQPGASATPQFQLAPPPGQDGQPADTRPALRPEIEGPVLNGSNGITIESSTSAPPLNRYIPQPVTSQRPAPTTVTPSSTAPAPAGQWKVTPVTPIPDPQFSNSGSTSEAPRLLDPRDKTAGLDQRSLVIPVGYEMAQQPPRRSFTPPTASIQADNDGWYSLNK